MNAEATIDAAAKAIYMRHFGVDWDNEAEEVRGLFRRDAQAALEAAGRLLAAELWDAGFTACAHEHMHQAKDPKHPITRANPYAMTHVYMWEGKPISREDLQSRLDEMRAVMEEADENRRKSTYGG